MAREGQAWTTAGVRAVAETLAAAARRCGDLRGSDAILYLADELEALDDYDADVSSKANAGALPVRRGPNRPKAWTANGGAA